jgi:hypothetical protein
VVSGRGQGAVAGLQAAEEGRVRVTCSPK